MIGFDVGPEDFRGSDDPTVPNDIREPECSACRGTGRTGCRRDGNECMSSSCTTCDECGGTGKRDYRA